MMPLIAMTLVTLTLIVSWSTALPLPTTAKVGGVSRVRSPRLVSDEWAHGEVAWDLEELTDANQYQEQVIIPRVLITYGGNGSRSSAGLEENTIYEKYFKNKIFFRVKKSTLRGTYWGIWNALYRDLNNYDKVISDLQDISIGALKNRSAETDLALVLIATGLNLLQARRDGHAPKKPRKKSITRVVGALVVILSTLLLRNVRSVE